MKRKKIKIEITEQELVIIRAALSIYQDCLNPQRFSKERKSEVFEQRSEVLKLSAKLNNEENIIRGRIK